MSKFNIEKLGTLHPSIRADDWRSPLVIRLLKSGPYADGADEFELDYLDKGAGCAVQRLDFCWSGLGDDYKRCQNTYQATVITEFAALGLSCLATKNVAGLEITEVTRRGDRADYWLDDDSLLEVSGQASGNLDTLQIHFGHLET